VLTRLAHFCRIEETSMPTNSTSHPTVLNFPTTARLPRSERPVEIVETAIVYCEENFGTIDGKTANGLVRHSEKYKILSVIDSRKTGLDAGEVLDNRPNGIPIFADLDAALKQHDYLPDTFIFGMAPASGMMSADQRKVVLDAIHRGLNIVNGLHEFLNDDPVFVSASKAKNVTIRDVRRPRDKNELRLFSGRINSVTCPRIAVLGTDCAIGKRTTANLLADALNKKGIKAIMVGTGQTGLMQGARYGVALDAVPSQFCTGELEATIVEAYENENPDIIIVEGQGALSHPAFCTSAFILRGSVPHGVILQHAPRRSHRCDFADLEMPTPASEISLIQAFADTRVIGLTINHEHMTDADVDAAVMQYQHELGIPVTDALKHPIDHLVAMAITAFPEIRRKVIAVKP
jgi:uncharacterized NAD-dependent epimerase/dehydratase family protein